MKYKETTLAKLNLVGISIRTNNLKVQSQGDIAKLWEVFFSQNILSNVKDKISDDIYCVYTDYESDHTGDYTTFIGCVVSQIEDQSSELATMHIEADAYNEFQSEGAIPDCVMKTWNHIWQTNYNRAYNADFDVYKADVTDPQNARVITYLSIKE